MNESEITIRDASWRDYLELCKPNVVGLMLVTSIIGMMLSVKEMVPILTLVFGNLGIALCAASAAVINHVVDRHVDDKMARTIGRPVADGRIKPFEAMIFSASMCLLGVLILYLYTNILTIWLTLASLVGYAFVYTMFLKRATPQNIVIGGLAGAAPPLLGWTAVTGEIHHNALLLVLIIFAWTPPHFWALAVHRKEEYAKVGIPMLPVTHGEQFTKINILLYTLLLLIVTTLPYLTGMFGLLYLIGEILLGLIFLYWAFVMLVNKDKDAGIKTFRYSITYLAILFVLMLVDHYLFLI
jgi:protoheme IX farnesyltransferase